MKIEIYGKEGCSYCTLAKQHMDRHGLPYTYLDINGEGVKAALQARLPEGFALKQVPQIFIDDVHVGGYIDMTHWLLARTKLKDGV